MTMTKRVMLISVLLLLALPAITFLLLQSIDFNRYKPLIQEQITESLGRTLSIKGDIELDIGFSSRLVANHIELSNASWGSQETMISIDRAEAEVALLPLLFGDLHLNRLVLQKPNILLETDSSGKGNWQFHKPDGNNTIDDGEDKQQDSTLLKMDHVLFSSVKINYRNGVSGENTHFSLDSIEASTGETDDGFTARIAGSIDNKPTKILIQLSSVDKLMTGQSSTLTMEVEYGGKKHRQFNAQIVGELGITASAYAIEELQVTLNENQLTGRIHYDLVPSNPLLTADLYFETLSLHPFIGGAKGTGSKKASPHEKLFSTEKIDFSVLKDINAKITIKGKKVLGSSLVLDNLMLKAKLADGVLMVSPFTIDIEGSTIHNMLMLDTRKRTPEYKLSSKGKKLSLGEILNKTDTTDILISAPAAIDISLRGRGDSPAALAGSLSGHLFVDIGRGRVNNEYLNLIGADLTAKLLNAFDSSDIEEKPYTQLECAVINLRPRNGIIKYDKKVVMETDKMAIISSGIIDLKKETLQVVFVPRPRKDTKGLGLGVGGLVSAAQLEGTLMNPTLGLHDTNTVKNSARFFGALATGGTSILLEGLFSKMTADAQPCQTAKGIKKPRKKSIKDTIVEKFRDFKKIF